MKLRPTSVVAALAGFVAVAAACHPADVVGSGGTVTIMRVDAMTSTGTLQAYLGEKETFAPPTVGERVTTGAHAVPEPAAPQGVLVPDESVPTPR